MEEYIKELAKQKFADFLFGLDFAEGVDGITVRDDESKSVPLLLLLSGAIPYFRSKAKDIERAVKEFPEYYTITRQSYTERKWQKCLVVVAEYSENDVCASTTIATPSSDDKKKELFLRVSALANDVQAPEGERRNAMRMAQKLMSKYHFEAVEEQQERGELCFATTFSENMRTWYRVLGSIVGENFCCKCCTNGVTISFFGHEEDTLVARHMFEYLYKAGDKTCRDYVKTVKENGYSTKDVYNSVVQGFLCGVQKELTEGSTALALTVPNEVQSVWEQLGFAVGKPVKFNDVDSVQTAKAYMEGVANGKAAVRGRRVSKHVKSLKCSSDND